jgi:hypothetical protein
MSWKPVLTSLDGTLPSLYDLLSATSSGLGLVVDHLFANGLEASLIQRLFYVASGCRSPALCLLVICCPPRVQVASIAADFRSSSALLLIGEYLALPAGSRGPRIHGIQAPQSGGICHARVAESLTSRGAASGGDVNPKRIERGNAFTDTVQVVEFVTLCSPSSLIRS